MKQIDLNRKSSVKHPCLGFEHVLAFEWTWISSTLQWPNCFAFFGRKHHWIKVVHQQHLSLPKGRWWFAKSFLAAVLLTHVTQEFWLGWTKTTQGMHHQEFTSMGPSMFADIPAGGGVQKKERASIVPLVVLAKLLVVSDCFLPQPGKARTDQ